MHIHIHTYTGDIGRNLHTSLEPKRAYIHVHIHTHTHTYIHTYTLVILVKTSTLAWNKNAPFTAEIMKYIDTYMDA